jgi:hypothetical protein
MSPRHSDEECLHIAYESLELMRINDMERLDKNLVKDSEFEFRVIPTSLDDRARSKKEMMAACGDFAKGTAHIEVRPRLVHYKSQSLTRNQSLH